MKGKRNRKKLIIYFILNLCIMGYAGYVLFDRILLPVLMLGKDTFYYLSMAILGGVGLILLIIFSILLLFKIINLKK